MTTRPIPACVLRSWPDIAAASWQWASPLRLRAPHPHVADVVWLVVVDATRQHAMGRPVQLADSPDTIRAAWAALRMSLMRQLAREIACTDGTPVIRHDGRCEWCGSPAAAHHLDEGR